jgi:CheY-like chemotaxis protein
MVEGGMTEPPVVLYIEDNPTNQQLVARALQRSPNRPVVIAAADGTQGLRAARARQPDLVLLDLGLPDLPGRQVLARLRAWPGTMSVPVVVISGDAHTVTKTAALAAGASAYLTKPIDIGELLHLTDLLLQPAARQQHAG